MFFFGIFAIGLFVFCIIVVNLSINEIPKETLDEKFDITIGDYLNLLWLLMLISFVAVGNVFYTWFVSSYLNDRKRRTF